MKTLTKSALVDRLESRGMGYTKKELRETLDAVFQIMTETFVDGQSVKLSGFGNFTVNNKSARVGRNPATDAEIIISRRRVLTYKASNRILTELNKANRS